MRPEDDMATFRGSDLLVAGALLTRLPLPHAPRDAFDRAARAVWAYPVVGLGLAVLASVVWMLAGWLGVGPVLQAGLTLAALVAMTGALHEDGLADTADGLWGGRDAARRLEIMRDSRIGSYGVIALVLGLGLRWFALAAAGPAALVASASLSRGVLPLLMAREPMARRDGLAHAQGQPPERTAWIALGIGAAVAVVFGGLGGAILSLLAVAGLAHIIARLARARIGGITGDILGATQQVCELAILLLLIG